MTTPAQTPSTAPTLGTGAAFTVELLAELLNFSTDVYDCDACVAANALPAMRKHGCCPYHLGIERGVTYAAAKVTAALRALEDEE
ncbi:hypothetical protein [Actinomadura montaniterrae]|uniref:Uncharacterized protein n=1 Tax=Actinomadura montaniterrae TaxID=1803903 RepID=A0A6L3VM35_9ACTN|nr:hypothetical protein [Actinomadura montaniterrae]KAB2371129.1 hypothetical protein F9B16_32965 [Actinomadura montaniterrae]